MGKCSFFLKPYKQLVFFVERLEYIIGAIVSSLAVCFLLIIGIAGFFHVHLGPNSAQNDVNQYKLTFLSAIKMAMKNTFDDSTLESDTASSSLCRLGVGGFCVSDVRHRCTNCIDEKFIRKRHRKKNSLKITTTSISMVFVCINCAYQCLPWTYLGRPDWILRHQLLRMICILLYSLRGIAGYTGSYGGLLAMGQSPGGAAQRNAIWHRRPQTQPGMLAAGRGRSCLAQRD